MTPKVPLAARLAFSVIGVVALVIVVLAAPFWIFMLFGVGDMLLGVALLAGDVGALILVIVMNRVVRTGQQPSGTDKTALLVSAFGLTVGMIAFLPANSRLGAALSDPALVAAMRSDLRNLVEAESLYYAASDTHTQDLAALDWSPSLGVTVIVGQADSSGWQARAVHKSTEKSCTMSGRRLPEGNYQVQGPTCQ